MKLSEYIKNYRKTNNLTQTDLASKLYVSKQAISKWENDICLPDVSLYPTLSEMLNVSIDELMGISKRKNKANSIFIILTGIIFTILIILLITLLVPQNYIKRKHIVETEKYLEVKLPKLKEYQFKEFNEWQNFNNYHLPQDMYYFVFNDEIINIDNTWVSSFNDEVINILPSLAESYLETCDLYKLVCKDTNEVNQIPTPNDKKYSRLVLYCLQIESKRLIVINFEVENEKIS